MTRPAKDRPRQVLAHINPRRTCTTCVREWCETVQPPDEKDTGCTLWRDRGDDDD